MSYCLTSINANDIIAGSINFKWSEFLWVPQWQICVIPESDIVRANIIKTSQALQHIRTYFKKPITVTSGYRPLEYNKILKNSAPRSSHITGRAVDFVVDGIDCDQVRIELEPMLIHLDIRMERKPKSNWVHIDLDINKSRDRYFKP